jgi:hypothetical protein
MTYAHLETTGRDALPVVEDLDVIDHVVATDEPIPGAMSVAADRVIEELADRNLFGEANWIVPGRPPRACGASTPPSAPHSRNWLRDQHGLSPVGCISTPRS